MNNAGVNTRGYFRDITAEEVREMVIVNTYPYTLLTSALLKSKFIKPESNKTLVLSVCSVIAFLPSAYDAVYAATKAFEVF